MKQTKKVKEIMGSPVISEIEIVAYKHNLKGSMWENSQWAYTAKRVETGEFVVKNSDLFVSKESALASADQNFWVNLARRTSPIGK